MKTAIVPQEVNTEMEKRKMLKITLWASFIGMIFAAMMYGIAIYFNVQPETPLYEAGTVAMAIDMFLIVSPIGVLWPNYW